MQEVTHADLPMSPIGTDDSLSARAIVFDDGAWRLTDSDHNYLVMRKKHLEGMDYTDKIFEDIDTEVIIDEDGEGELSSDDKHLLSGSENETSDEE